MWNSVAYTIAYFWGLSLLGFWDKDSLFLFRSTNEVQPSHEWECHHLRPAYIAVSVLLHGGKNQTHLQVLFWREYEGRGGEGRKIAGKLLSAEYSPLVWSSLRWVQFDSVVFPALEMSSKWVWDQDILVSESIFKTFGNIWDREGNMGKEEHVGKEEHWKQQTWTLC